jgi:hypothetical protein
MESNLSKAVGAAGSCIIDGKTCLMSRLKVKDIAQWEEFIKGKLKSAENPFDKIKDQIRFLRSEEKRTVLKIAYDNAYSMDSLDSPQAKRIMDGMDSRAFMVWLSARKEQPDVTREQTAEAIGEMEPTELADLVEAISGMGGKPKGKDERVDEPRPGSNPTG